MDEQRFDDIIRKKVGDYVDPTFDEGAIAGLHQHLAGYQATPWYLEYKSAGIMAATLALFTFINWLMIRDNGISGQSTENTIPRYEELIQELQGEINRLQSMQPDTIYVVNQTPSNQGVLSASLGDSRTNPDDVINTFLLRLKEGESIGQVGDYYFYHKESIPDYGDFIALNSRNENLDGSLFHLSYPDQDTIYKQGSVELVEEDYGRMPLVVIKDLEKHYSKGLGLKLGGELELSHTKPGIGSGEILPGGGVLAELVFSPSLALETGIKYKTRSYDAESVSNEDLTAFPGIDSTLEPVNELEGDAKLLEIPLNFKLYRPIAQNKDLYFSLGISPNIYLSQAFEYSHPTGEVNLPAEANLTSEAGINGPDFYLGTMNAGAGLSFDLPKSRTVQVGLFYQKDINRLGVEEQKMNILGLKSSYWFRVR